ncbi:hypothetical protein [Paraflavitalea pollutisoli]|uniref:hypothetical protein n=1 Tax=Paraflavitalea pollutisoli TaxID=3034143 RepID=UPI0023EC70B0|nr:hypothetical protein [Paraflavitalea sp. H1-2-19X]
MEKNELRKKVMKDVDEFVKNAKKHGSSGLKFTLKSGEQSSLHKMIKTKEQAHIFMTLLKSL